MSEVSAFGVVHKSAFGTAGKYAMKLKPAAAKVQSAAAKVKAATPGVRSSVQQKASGLSSAFKSGSRYASQYGRTGVRPTGGTRSQRAAGYAGLYAKPGAAAAGVGTVGVGTGYMAGKKKQ